MNNFLWIAGGVALIAFAYVGYKRRESRKPLEEPEAPVDSKEEAVKKFIEEIQAQDSIETVNLLSLADVVFYFKSMQLRKGIDVPFIAQTLKDDRKIYLLATYDEEENEVKNYRLISPDKIDDKIAEMIGEELLVVLS